MLYHKSVWRLNHKNPFFANPNFIVVYQKCNLITEHMMTTTNIS